jgi:capsular polysaccharide biosynthesis protein
VQGDMNGAPAPTFGDYMRVLRRRAWVVAATTALTVAIAALFIVLKTPRYESTAQVLLSRDSPAAVLTGTTGTNDKGDPELFTQTQLQIARSPLLAQRVLARLRLRDRTPTDLQTQTEAVVPATTDVLGFQVQDRDRALTAKIADTYAREFITYQRQLDRDAFAQALRDVSARLTALEATGQTDTPVYRGLSTKREELQTLQPLETGKAIVLSPAMRVVRVSPAPKRDVIAGLGAGLLLGALLAFAVDAADRRVYAIDSLAEQLGSPVLGRLPARSRLRLPQRGSLLERGAGEAYQVLRGHLERSLQANGLELPRRLVMLTAAGRDADASTVVARLSVALALAGRSVIVVEGHERSRLRRILGQPSGRGMIDVMRGEAPLERAIVRHRVGDGEIGLLRLGGPRRAYVELLASGEVGALLDRLRFDPDVVLVDAPALSDGRGALEIAEEVDAFAVVVPRDGVPARILPALRATLAEASALDLGLIAIGGSGQSAAFDPAPARLALAEPPASTNGTAPAGRDVLRARAGRTPTGGDPRPR